MTKQVLLGVVVGIAGKDTLRVKVERETVHPLYQKRMMRSKSFLVHDPDGEARVGDDVEMVSCNPISKRKRYILTKVIK